VTAPPLRVLVVDDEAPARTLLVEYLAAEPGIVVVGECANGFEAVKAVAQLQPDLLLLDIQMPKLDGFEVLELLRPAPAVVFVTAHDEHALRAFEVHAVDYLLKPVAAERLSAALARVRAQGGASPEAAPAAVLRQAARPAGGGYLERIATRAGTAVHVFPVGRLDYAEAQDDFLVLVAAGVRHRKQQTLNELEALLDPARFVRIHRSYLLNVERLARVELYAKDSRVAILADGTKLPVSRAGYARLQELL
jgi:two-component system, LytTR family, response regulator